MLLNMRIFPKVGEKNQNHSIDSMLNLMLYLQAIEENKWWRYSRYSVVDVKTANYYPDNLASWLPLRTFPCRHEAK